MLVQEEEREEVVICLDFLGEANGSSPGGVNLQTQHSPGGRPIALLWAEQVDLRFKGKSFPVSEIVW